MLRVALRHRFPGIEIDIEFAVPVPGVTVLFGPSGAGKSTVIAAAAGLLPADECRIELGGAVLADTRSGIFLPPERRHVGLVFQEARLFPHMSVRDNLLFGQRRTRNRRIGLDEVVALLGIAALLARRPHTLSGGERQRVAIGRALLRQPDLLLMDEPLAGLDGARKAEILPYLARLKGRLELPVLYVTHSLDELAQLADQVVLIEAGRVRAMGPVAAMAARADLGLAAREDAGAVLPCVVAAHEPARQLSRLRWGDVELLVPQTGLAVGTALRVRVPVREVILARHDAATLAGALSLHNVLPGRVRAITADPARQAALVEVAVGAEGLLARVTPDAVARLGLAPGVAVAALIKSMSVEVLGGLPVR